MPVFLKIAGPRKPRHGFTLIELMTAMIIFAVMAAIAIPTITAWLPQWRANSAARQIGSTLQLARLKAATNSAEYRVFINTTTLPLSIQVEKGDRPSGSTVWFCESNNYYEFHDSIQFGTITPTATEADIDICRPDGSSPNVFGHVVVFLPSGGTTAGNEVTVQLTNIKGDKFKITVSNTTGRVRVERGW